MGIVCQHDTQSANAPEREYFRYRQLDKYPFADVLLFVDSGFAKADGDCCHCNVPCFISFSVSDSPVLPIWKFSNINRYVAESFNDKSIRSQRIAQQPFHLITYCRITIFAAHIIRIRRAKKEMVNIWNIIRKSFEIVRVAVYRSCWCCYFWQT